MKHVSVASTLALSLILGSLGCSGERSSFQNGDDDPKVATADAGEVSPSASTPAPTASQGELEPTGTSSSEGDSNDPSNEDDTDADTGGDPSLDTETETSTGTANPDDDDSSESTLGSKPTDAPPDTPAMTQTAPNDVEPSDSTVVPTSEPTEPTPDPDPTSEPPIPTTEPSVTSSTPGPTSEPSTPPTPADPKCETECCANEDCANDRVCDDGVCECASGTKDCDGQCIDDDACCSDDECGASSHCAQGACECDSDAHQCGDVCVADDSPETCGDRCEACPSPTGGEAGCEAAECTATCPSGKKLCAGACIANNSPCDAECAQGSHDCEGLCIQRTSTLACGTSCTPCTAPANATATCDGTSCDFECAANYTRCDDKCVPDTGCCNDDDCDGDKECNASNSCVCAGGTKLCGSSCIADSACCSDGDCGAGLGCRNSLCVDTAAPTVTNITPNNNAKGVASNSLIKLTFNEAMNQASVQSALSINLSSGSYTLSWNSAGTELTITPTSALAYGTASSIGGGGAKTFTIGVATTAKDLNDNRLATAFSSSFTTLRRITQTLSPSVVGRGSSFAQQQGNGPFLCDGASASVGPFSTPGGAGTYYIWLEYDLSLVGEPSQITTLESAKFFATQAAQAGSFYPNGRVDLVFDEYADIDGWYTAAVERSLSTLSSDTTVAVVKTITTHFMDDWEDFGSDQLYELNASGQLSSNNLAKFTCTGFSLELVFLTP